MNPHETSKPAVHRFPCSNCGSDLRFSPSLGVLKCDHCGFREEHSPPVGSIREHDFDEVMSNTLPDDDAEFVRFTSCLNCGAKMNFGGGNYSAECPYCATPVVLNTPVQKQLKPNGVLPFQIEENEAHEALTLWLAQRWFAPTGFNKYARKGQRMQGVYVPYWTFDAMTKSSYVGKRGIEYSSTETREVNGEKVQRTVTKVRWAAVSGSVSRFFDDILVLASHALPDRFTQAIEPWDLSTLQPFQADFLAGFRSEVYSLELENGYRLAQKIMRRQVQIDVRFDIGGDRQQIGNVDTSTSNISFKQILLPIWLASYKYRGKSYRFVVNGQTRKTEGDRPFSSWKIILALFAVASVGGVIFLFYSQIP